MSESVRIAGAEYKTASQLERIRPEFVLRVACGFGAGAGLGIVSSQQVEEVRTFEFHDGISFPLFVNQ